MYVYGKDNQAYINDVLWLAVKILEIYDFLEAGDVLESSGYDIEGLHNANHSFGKLYVALNAALLL